MRRSAALCAAPALLALALIAVALRAGAADAQSAEAPDDYLLHCSACHALDGAGVPGVVPTLHGVAALLAAPGGREYLVQVPGVAQAPLSDARIARLLDWVLLTYSGAAPAPPYEATEVGALRAAPLRDPGSVKRTLEAALSRPPDAGMRTERDPDREALPIPAERAKAGSGSEPR